MFRRCLKIFFCCLVSIVSTSIHAFQLDISDFTRNAYGGIGLGMIVGQFQVNSDTVVSPSSAFFYDQASQPLVSNTDVLGTLFVGKLFHFNQYRIGPEISLNIGAPTVLWTQSASLLFPVETLSTQTKSHLNIVSGGFDARFGYAFRDSNLFYGRLGFEVNRLSNEVIATDARPLNNYYSITTNTFANTLIGLRAGLGFEQEWYSHWSIRGDYVFSYYPSQSQTASNTQNSSGFALGPVTNTSQIQVNTHAILFSLVYHWDADYEK